MMRRVTLTSHTMRRLAATALLCTVAGVGWADEPIDETKPAAADGRVVISNLSGSVMVTGWDRDEISVQALYRMRSARQRLQVVLPAGVEFDTDPARINGNPVTLQSQEGTYFVPLVDRDADK